MPYRLRLPLFFVLSAVLPLLAGIPAQARTGEPWDAPAFSAEPAALLRAAAAVEAGEGGVAVLLAETRYEYDEAGRETYTYRLVYRIASASAHDSWSAIEEGWSPWHQEKPSLRARVITPDGAVHSLDPSTIAENGEAAQSPDMFEDDRVLRAPLPATGAGAVVEQEVVVHETAPFFAGGVLHVRPLPMAVPVRLTRLVLEAPAAAPLRWAARLLPAASPREETVGGRRRITFEYRDLPAAEEAEPGMAPEAPRVPYVAFSTGRSWADLAQRYSAIVDQAIRGADLAPFLRAAGGGASQLELIDRLLARLGNEVRYTGIELGQGGLIPRPPAETLRRKFGDCKDKAVLLTALLRASDIPAYVALLNAAEDEQDVEEALPGFGGFNHAIVMVPGHPALWIDPTDPYARAGELPVEDQGRLALIASPTATSLVRTPEAKPADNREQEVREFYLADLGPARVVETNRYWGATERALRAFYALEDKGAVRDSLAQYMQSAFRADDLTAFESSPPADLSQPFRLRLEAAKAGRGVTDVADAAVALVPRDLLKTLPDELAPPDGTEEDEEADDGPRQSEYVFSRPFQAETIYRVVPPAGFAPQPLPASRVRHLGPATLSEEYSAAADGTVTATLRFDVGKRRLTPQEFTALRDGVRGVAEDKPVLIAFEQIGEAHLGAGRVREALAEFDRLAAAAPNKALARTRIARALLAGGMGEAARQEAERAVQLEPRLALTHRTLGWVLEHDALGRRFGRGYDRKGAIAAYRKARQLDPADEVARAALAILLEHDADGERYSRRADLPAAIEEYRSLRTDLASSGMDDNLLVALLRAERFQEMRDLLDKLEETSSRKVLRLVATSALQGAEAAVKEADRRFPEEKARGEALGSAAQNLILLRRYAEAAVFLDRASRQAPNAAEMLAMVELLKKTRRGEDVPVSTKEPGGVVLRLMQALASGDADPAKIAALFTRDVAKELLDKKNGAALQRKLAGSVLAMRRQLRGTEMPPQVATDIALAAFHPNVAGDDATGYRVRLVSSMGQGPKELLAFVVREEGEYRLLASAADLELLGREALRHLQRGDLAAARRWLGWAHEEMAPLHRSGDDPLATPPFVTLWDRNREAPADASDASDIDETRCAAASLMAQGAPAREALPILLACRDAAPEARRTPLDLAIAYADRQLERWADLSEAARRLLAAAPGSDAACALATVGLAEQGRWPELRKIAEARLERTPGDPLGLRTLATLDQRDGDFDTAEERLGKLVADGKAAAGDYNSLAWIALLRGKADDHAVEQAQRSVTLSEYKSYSGLHTLASLYAELGRTAEAYRVILQALEAKEDDAPDAVDWYVFGRLAESYGLPDAARHYYERVEPKDKAEPTSTYRLARRRLDALDADRPVRASRSAR
jgi:tetratricopeptide (TPR) repeat protein